MCVEGAKKKQQETYSSRCIEVLCSGFAKFLHLSPAKQLYLIQRGQTTVTRSRRKSRHEVQKSWCQSCVTFRHFQTPVDAVTLIPQFFHGVFYGKIDMRDLSDPNGQEEFCVVACVAAWLRESAGLSMPLWWDIETLQNMVNIMKISNWIAKFKNIKSIVAEYKKALEVVC
ncbi:uncharacterized protein EV420DRAFT_1485332 [Desarmillaria tabescens]|uniref:Uncharacterized protein n=1 Tax=Armillaria tabescens TaxID=1929756 RepID=A0AA39JHZ1_ARMTA|nr:uncharacterized protein EV420DRAFT_1485332 [Desarmillaria tabescens]KAK0442512.1 hypothetical protein EV420DRAFT_1485332 [Desarmillaria tabescens]